MGSGRDKRKKNARKTGEAPAGVGAAKTEAKTAKKTERRAAAAARAADDDLDALLKQFELADARVERPLVEELEPGGKGDAMPARAYASAAVVADGSLVGGAPNQPAVLFYGGERLDVRGRRETLHTFGDLWVFRPPASVPAPFPPSSGAAPAAAAAVAVAAPGSETDRDEGGGGAGGGPSFEGPKVEDPGRWTRVVTPAKSSPPPRSSHQAVLLPGGAAASSSSSSSSSSQKKTAFLYVFGGELTSKDMTKFRHYRDLWRLRLGGGSGGSSSSRSDEGYRSSPWSWESLPTKAGPSARSGHRMAAWKGNLLLFGGFHDDGSGKVEYFNDVWLYDTAKLSWSKLETNAAAGPSPRGGCQLLVAPAAAATTAAAAAKSPAAVLEKDTLFVFGGHTAGNDDGGGDGDGTTGTGKVHDDIWALPLTLTSSSSSSRPPLRWTRLARSSLGFAPTPRASFGLAANPPLSRRRAILWGGIVDRAGARDRVFSEHCDDLYAFNVDLKRWFPIALRGPPVDSSKQKRKSKKNNSKVEGAKAEEEKEKKKEKEEGVATAATAAAAAAAKPKDDEPKTKTKQELLLEAAATRIQSRYRGHAVRRAVQALRLGSGRVSELLYSPALLGPGGALAAEAARRAPRPRARAAPTLLTINEKLWLFGGVVEVEHTDVTLDDVWCLDLKSLQGWVCVRPDSRGEAAFEASDWETDDGEDDGEDDFKN